MATFIGIDLAGSPKRNTGICIICNGNTTVQVAHTNEEIYSILSKYAHANPIIGIDAPLTLPKGRRSIEENNGIHFRQCDLELRKRRIRFFPITLGPMRMLTARGMELKAWIEKNTNARVYEMYPGATFDVFGIERKNQKQILSWARKFVKLQQRKYIQDELDAIAGAITMKLFNEGKADMLGKEDGIIVVAKKD